MSDNGWWPEGDKLQIALNARKNEPSRPAKGGLNQTKADLERQVRDGLITKSEMKRILANRAAQ